MRIRVTWHKCEVCTEAPHIYVCVQQLRGQNWYERASLDIREFPRQDGCGLYGRQDCSCHVCAWTRNMHGELWQALAELQREAGTDAEAASTVD